MNGIDIEKPVLQILVNIIVLSNDIIIEIIQTNITLKMVYFCEYRSEITQHGNSNYIYINNLSICEFHLEFR